MRTYRDTKTQIKVLGFIVCTPIYCVSILFIRNENQLHSSIYTDVWNKALSKKTAIVQTEKDKHTFRRCNEASARMLNEAKKKHGKLEKSNLNLMMKEKHHEQTEREKNVIEDCKQHHHVGKKHHLGCSKLPVIKISREKIYTTTYFFLTQPSSYDLVRRTINTMAK